MHEARALIKPQRRRQSLARFEKQRLAAPPLELGDRRFEQFATCAESAESGLDGHLRKLVNARRFLQQRARADDFAVEHGEQDCAAAIDHVLFRTRQHLAIDRLDHEPALEPLGVDALEMRRPFGSIRHGSRPRRRARARARRRSRRRGAHSRYRSRNSPSASISVPCPRNAARARRAADRAPHGTETDRACVQPSAESSSTPRRASALSVRRVTQPDLAQLRRQLADCRMGLPDCCGDFGNRRRPFDVQVAQHRKPMRIDVDAARGKPRWPPHRDFR